jgi:hypothetical protein
MTILEELSRVAARNAPYEIRPVCDRCDRGELCLVDETPDPLYGRLGVTRRTLRCNNPACGKTVID